MSRDLDWPEFCTLLGCTDPYKKGHHHHMVRGHINNIYCTCEHIDIPGTRPY